MTQGLDACLKWIEKGAYLETAFSKMYNIEPISSGLVTIPVRYKSKPDVYVETAILCWSNGVVLAMRKQGEDEIQYICYTKPEKVSNAQTLQEQAELQEAASTD